MRLFYRGFLVGAVLVTLALSILALRIFTPVAAPVALDRAPYLQDVTSTGATVLWQTKRAAPAQILWGLPGARAWQSLKLAASTWHRARLSDLKPNTLYRYQLAGSAVQGQFTTAPPPGSPAPVRFAAWGDSGVDSAGQKKLATQIARFQPAFLVHTGDLIYPRGAWADYDPKFFHIYAPLLENAPFYGCIGNHDNLTERAAPWLANFEVPRNGPGGLTPERNYSFQWGNAQFWVMDGNAPGAQMKTIAAWLQNGIAHSKATWKIAVFHQPPYSSGLHGGYGAVKKYYAPILERGVDVVLSGHDHDYERFPRKGTAIYIVTGAGGAPLYPKAHPDPTSAKYDNHNWSFSAFTVKGRSLKCQQIAASGTVLDEWKLAK